jgi:histidine triad (HIT) family protein
VDDCIFCAIAAGHSPANMVHSDDVLIAIMDIAPINPGHLLVLPRAHIRSLSDMDDETGARLFNVTRRMARAIQQSGLKCEGINLFLADGEAAFQEIFHVHMHVLPRFRGDAFRITADWSVQPSREELDAVATQIRQADQPP